MALFASEVEGVGQGVYGERDLSHINKLFELCHRMAQYLQTATVSQQSFCVVLITNSLSNETTCIQCNGPYAM